MKSTGTRLAKAVMCCAVMVVPQLLTACSVGPDRPLASPSQLGPVVVTFEPNGSALDALGTGTLNLGHGGCLEISGPTAFPVGTSWVDGRLVGFGTKTYALGDTITFTPVSLSAGDLGAHGITFPKGCLPDGSKVLAALPNAER